MIILFITLFLLYCCIVLFLCHDRTPHDFNGSANPRPRRTPADFVRSAFRKLGQRQVRKNDRRLFAAGDKHAFP